MAASAAETKTEAEEEEEAIVAVPCRLSCSSPPLTLNGGDDLLSASRLLRDDPESLQEKVRRRRLALLRPALLLNLASPGPDPYSRLQRKLISGIA